MYAVVVAGVLCLFNFRLYWQIYSSVRSLTDWETTHASKDCVWESLRWELFFILCDYVLFRTISSSYLVQSGSMDLVILRIIFKQLVKGGGCRKCFIWSSVTWGLSSALITKIARGCNFVVWPRELKIPRWRFLYGWSWMWEQLCF